MKKYQIIYIVVIILFLSWLFGLYLKEQLQIKQAMEMSVPAPTGFRFASVYADFNDNYKRALIYCEENNLASSKSYLASTTALWAEIATNTRQNKPREFFETRDYAAAANDIWEYLLRADKKLEENDVTSAYAELDQVRRKLSALRKENKREGLADYLIATHDAVRGVAGAKDKKSAAASFSDLKLNLAFLKGYPVNQEYQAMLVELERVVAELDKSDGPDWEQGRNELKTLFNKLYLQFG
jgi:hypothetical protein